MNKTYGERLAELQAKGATVEQAQLVCNAEARGGDLACDWCQEWPATEYEVCKGCIAEAYRDADGW